MIIFRSDMIFYVLAAYVFVAGCNTRSQTASPREAAYTVTLRELDREISDPPTIAGEFKDSAFIKAYYVPHLRTAKASLSDLLIGKRARCRACQAGWEGVDHFMVHVAPDRQLTADGWIV